MHRWMNGTAAAERPIIPPYSVRGRSYRTSAFRAQLIELNAGAIDNVGFVQNTVVPVLLYLSDYPADLEGQARYNDVTNSNGAAWPATHQRISQDCAHAPRIDVAPFTQVLTSVQTTVARGELSVGVTPTNGVATFGYMAHINVELTNWESDGIGTLSLPRLILRALANCAVVDSPVTSGGAIAPGPSFPALARFPVLMREQHYTQAMRDAGDVYTDVNGLECQIVGLHDVSAVAIPA